MSVHTWHYLGPCKPSSCTTFTLNSYLGKAATGKKKVLPLCIQGCFIHVQLFATLCGLPGSSVREGILQAGILERIGQYWLPYPSRALYSLLP